MVSDGAGGAILALDAYYDESPAHIYVQRIDPVREFLWISPR
jgi:hypothetical protein